MQKKPPIVNILFGIIIFSLFLVNSGCQFEKAVLSEEAKAEELWLTSGHANSFAEAFTYWDEDDPKVVETDCAKCHSTPGFIDYLDNLVVDTAPAVGTTVECEACHTDPEQGTLRDHTSVTFPSTVVVENLGPEALCMECHQGRESTSSVDEEIADAAPATVDTISSAIGFKNVHYFAAAAMQMGTVAKGGYEYSGNRYDARFAHVTGYNSCITCHNPHTLEVDLSPCNTCHAGTTDPKNIRYYGSYTDYDGDGNTTEGIYYEIQGMQEVLYEAIQAYGTEIGAPVVYEGHSYPYWFNDSNGNGEAEESEATYGNQYRSFTARFLKAAYNYQVSLKDPAGYAHGGKYIMELMYDSIEDLNVALTTPVDLDDLNRGDEGHFDGSTTPWRFRDSRPPFSDSCARCHTAAGLPYFLENGEDIEQDPSNGLLCTTCHTSPPNVRTAGAVTFPSGASLDMGDSSNLCLNCHRGRGSMADVDEKLLDPAPWSAPSIHYYPVAAVLFGSEAKAGYEFPGKTYAGRNPFPSHNGRFDTCVECHMGTNSTRKELGQSTYGDHNVHKPNPEDCISCHGYDVSQPTQGFDPSKFKFSGIRPGSIPDFDNDGNTSESLEAEILGLENAVANQAGIAMGTPLVYYHGYFYNDLNDNGLVDDNETERDNRYALTDERMLKAAYNLRLTYYEPHAYIHNPFYIAQLFVDSIEHLGGSIAAYTWR